MLFFSLLLVLRLDLLFVIPFIYNFDVELVELFDFWWLVLLVVCLV